MKKTVCIVDDVEDDYNELKNILESGSWKDLISIISPYFSNRPYKSAKEFILKNKPEILFLDYDLKSNKGDALFQEINTYNCYAIFLSSFHGEADAAAQFQNATFLNKHIEPIVRLDRLDAALTLAFMHLEKDKEVLLKLFKEDNENTLIETRIKCEDILLFKGIPGESQKYEILYLKKGKLITQTGPSRGGVGSTAKLLIDASTCFTLHKKHPYLVYNKWHFNLNLSTNQFESNEIISDEKIKFDR